MKKLLIFALLVSLLFIGCSPTVNPEINNSSEPNDKIEEENSNSGDYLIMISNVDSIKASDSSEVSKSITQGDSIIGVLLKFHGEGTYFRDSIIDLKHPHAFYLEYLGDGKTGKNGDGYEFNYVLYVPDIIKKEFSSALGKEVNNGNPFWWYMSQYFGKSLNEIRGNWHDTLTLLLDGKEKLPHPHRKDVSSQWIMTSKDFGNLTILTGNNGFVYEINEETKKVEITIPHLYYKNYSVARPADTSANAAFIYYLENCAEVDFDEFIKKIDDKEYVEDIVSKMNELYNNNPIKAEDIPFDGHLISVDSVLDDKYNQLSLSSVYLYLTGRIAGYDGIPIEKSDRIFFTINQYKDKDCITFYLPQSYIDEYEEKYGKWDGSGNVIWWYLKDNFQWTKNKDDFFIPADIIKKLLKYGIDD